MNTKNIFFQEKKEPEHIKLKEWFADNEIIVV
jgi:hypothetical protein